MLLHFLVIKDGEVTFEGLNLPRKIIVDHAESSVSSHEERYFYIQAKWGFFANRMTNMLHMLRIAKLTEDNRKRNTSSTTQTAETIIYSPKKLRQI